MINKDCYSKFK